MKIIFLGILLTLFVFVSCNSERSAEFALFEASLNNDFETIELLLSQNISVNAILTDRENRAFNELFIEKRNREFNSPAERRDFINESRRTPLILAIGNQNIEMVELFINHGANINKPESQSGQSPLILASGIGNYDLAELLIANGADVNAVCHRGQPVIIYPMSRENIEITNLLIKSGANINVTFNHDRATPLLLAVQRENVELVELLIAHGADINFIGARMVESVLERAIRLQNEQIISMFTNHININSGYQEFRFGMSVNDVRQLSPDITGQNIGRWGTPSNVIMYLYNDEFIPTVPNPLSNEAGLLTLYHSRNDWLNFYFVNNQLVAVEVDFFQENILPELFDRHGRVNLISGRFGNITFQTATWNNDTGRFIVYERHDRSPRATVTFISRSWLTPLMEKSMADFRATAAARRARLD